MLAQAQASLLEQDAALESHAEAVRSHELQVQRALREGDGSGMSHDSSENARHDAQARHDHARKAHERLKQHHDMITTEIKRLSEKLLGPM